MNERKWYTIQWLLLSFIFAVSLLILYFSTRNLYQRHYFKNLSLELTGIITAIETDEPQHHLGALYVAVLNSNKNYVDQSDSLTYYYCVVKNNKAVIYQPLNTSFALGDTIYVNTAKRKLIKHNNGQQITLKTKLLRNKDFFKTVSHSSLFQRFFSN